ncbi:NAD/NADP octopine/nopaline dehydrogenase family protein [Stappia taiwanensis]|uniref:2-dehydropantoate 2-reductase n=1 Tax=Stappia taiwanensis TaxID=992267 RepID=A0A838XUG1_9HYPH|nr:NAD/NADP-dependent octopine/nopaline dehydrogenase family protein [Stappia taiwanensis]MBA4612671.1 NAD/NADP octopine/nopaline dehydrogenase family protein [Stappia taiwanensis]GGE88595.1 opine dehydrogenase [Stappia taiwanensis]
MTSEDAAPSRVGIAGAGSIAFATAALLHDRGHEPMLWSPSGQGTAALANGDPLVATGALETTFSPRLAASAAELAAGNDVLVIAVPGYGHKAVMDALAPHIRAGQHIIISSHASMGALYLMRLLAERGIDAPVTAWGTTAVTGRRKSGTEVTVNTVRKLIDLCTVPASRSEEAQAVCRRLFGDRFQARDGLLAISLSNLNPQNHMGIALGNMTRMERGETWSQGQNVTPNVGRLLEALDTERLAIAEALGLEVRTIFEHFHLSFHVPVASISEMNQQMHTEGNGGTGPATADSRYVTEDVPYGLALTVALGALVGRPATLHEAGIRIFSAMYGRDFTAENELLTALDLTRFSLEELRQAAQTGRLDTTPVQEAC